MADIKTYRASASGIMRDIQKKLENSRDKNAEKRALDWMREVTGEAPTSENYVDALRNGAYLCDLMNAIKPNSIKKIRRTTNGQAFTVMQNLDLFLKAALDYGLRQEEIFQSVDLWEQRNINAVTKTIYALARCAKRNGWDGPELPLESPKMKDF